MKIEYFKDTDTLYIDIKETTSVETKEISWVLCSILILMEI